MNPTATPKTAVLISTTAAPTTADPRRIGRSAGFVVALVALVAMMVGASAPSPFYPVLQERIGFSAGVMTEIFGVYAVTLLLALLIGGSLSDHIGRRPMLMIGFGVLAVSMVGFWHADSVAVLMASRAVQGIAAGLLMSTLSATVVDLEPPDRPGSASTLNSVMPLLGLAVGALLGGLALDVVPAALTVVFAVLTGFYVLLAVASWWLPETSPRHVGWRSSLWPRVGIPAGARVAFRRSAPALFAGWATGGLYLSLGAPIVGRLLGADDHLVQGLPVTLLAGTGSLTSFLLRRSTPRRITLIGTTLLAVGTVLTLVALAAGTLIGFLLAVVVAGVGFGGAFLGILRSLTPTVEAHERSELFAAVFVVSYLAFGIPAVVAGFLSPVFGLQATATVYGLAVVVLSAGAALLRRFARD